MDYRILGKTGRRVSAVGLGCEHLDGKPYEQVKETIDAALDGGVNILDVFMPGDEVRGNIAKALNGRRGEVMIQGHIGSADINQQYDITGDMPAVIRYFETLLRLFGHIEFGMLFFIDSEDDYKRVFDGGLARYAERLREKGDISHIGFSSHNPETSVKVIQTGIVEMMMFSVNPAFDMLPYGEYVFDHFETGFGADQFRGIDPKRASLYRLCAKEQVGITVMKALGAGKLLSPEQSPYKKPLTIGQCIHYALSRPAVASVLTGCKTAAEMREALTYFQMSEADLDFSSALTLGSNDFRGSCVYCSHCQPCPAKIDIASVNKYLDIIRLTPTFVPPSVRSHYKSLGHGGADCVQCGHCENRCPFGVPVIANMAEAAKRFA